MQIWDLLPTDWRDELESKRQRIDQISEALSDFKSINPNSSNIFRALGQSPKDFRVVIVGQDPYPDSNFATGLAFSVPVEVLRTPASLKNIQQEFYADLGKLLGNDLSPWISQGVLLLNRILTCSTGSSLSHKNLGWQEVTDEVVRAVVRHNPNTVAILWGNSANELNKFFNQDLVISSAHPSPLSAHRGFFGSRPFSKANALLSSTGQKPIDW